MDIAKDFQNWQERMKPQLLEFVSQYPEGVTIGTVQAHFADHASSDNYHSTFLDLEEEGLVRVTDDPGHRISATLVTPILGTKEALSLVEGWLKDESGYDETNYPEIEAGLRENRGSKQD